VANFLDNAVLLIHTSKTIAKYAIVMCAKCEILNSLVTIQFRVGDVFPLEIHLSLKTFSLAKLKSEHVLMLSYCSITNNAMAYIAVE